VDAKGSVLANNQKERLSLGQKSRYTEEMRSFVSFLCLGLAPWVVSVKGGELAPGKSIPEYDRIFRQTNGWTGADGAYSVALKPGVTLWLYSDTWVGSIVSNRHHASRMINNSIVIQKGTDPATAEVEFIWRKGAQGEPESFVKPDSGEGWFWIFSGTRTSKGLYFFLPRFDKKGEDNNSAFNFKMTGMSVAEVPNPDDPPLEWKIKQVQLPFAKFDPQDHFYFGSAMVQADGMVYIYGVARRQLERGMTIARVPEARFFQFDEWEFFDGSDWTSSDPKIVLRGVIPSEFSVSYYPPLKKYAMVYTSFGISGKIEVRFGATPAGPWEPPLTVYDCPEKDWDRDYFSYAAKAHPQLAREPGELVITYATNARQFSKLVNDARIYWPTFVSVQLQSAQESPKSEP
jgi:hypothetical protein